MLSTDQRPVVEASEALRTVAAQVMEIRDTTYGGEKEYAARFRGRLIRESMAAYDWVAERYRALGYTALFRKEDDAHVIVALRGVDRPRPSRAWINYVLFAFTVISVLLTGASYGYEGPPPNSFPEWLSFLGAGWPFLVSMLGILLAHELGHYFAARHHKVDVTLPYFIPFPSLFGTMGAFIQLKSRPTNRRVLLDIGIAGPLAGLVVAVPVLIYGLMTSQVEPLPTVLPRGQGLSLEGNSLLYVLIKWAVFGQLLPTPPDFDGLPPLLYMLRYFVFGFPLPLGGFDVLLNDVAWAGWAGLLVTGLNLIPAGQLDGGHALYVLLGRGARRLLPVILVLLVGLGFFWNGWWIWAALIYFLVGRAYAEPLDLITELDPPRKLLAISALVLFVLVFTPVPLIFVGG